MRGGGVKGGGGETRGLVLLAVHVTRAHEELCAYISCFCETGEGVHIYHTKGISRQQYIVSNTLTFSAMGQLGPQSQKYMAHSWTCGPGTKSLLFLKEKILNNSYS